MNIGNNLGNLHAKNSIQCPYYQYIWVTWAHDNKTSSKCNRIQSNSTRQLKWVTWAERLSPSKKFYIKNIGHNLGNLHAKTLKVPKLPQFTLDQT